MASMLLPVLLFLLIGLAVLGLLLAERRPVRTWREDLRDAASPAPEGRVTVVSEDVSITDLMASEDTAPAYMGTDAFQGLVHVVDRTLDKAESATARRKAVAR